MSARRILAAIAIGRVLIGVAMLVLPGEVARRWLGRGAAGSESAALTRAVGGRDLAYAIGSLAAVRDGDPKPWLAAGLLVDGVDSWATLKAEGVPTTTKLTGGAMAFAAVAMNAAGLLVDEDA